MDNQCKGMRNAPLCPTARSKTDQTRRAPSTKVGIAYDLRACLTLRTVMQTAPITTGTQINITSGSIW